MWTLRYWLASLIASTLLGLGVAGGFGSIVNPSSRPKPRGTGHQIRKTSVPA
jgi:hypothetical protein